MKSKDILSKILKKNLLKIIFLSIIISTLISVTNSKTFSQNFDEQIFGFKPAQDLSYNEILSLKLNELLQLGNSFTYFEQLKNGSYSIDSTDNIIIKVNFINEKEVGKKRIKDKQKFIAFKKKEVIVNGIKFNYLELENENSLLNYEKARSFILENDDSNHDDPSPFPMIGYYWKQKIIMDMEILNFPGPGYYWGKILNKTFTKNKLLTSNGEPDQLYGALTDGVAFTFNSQYMKVFTVDKQWDRVIWFDQNMSNPYTRDYGEQGSGNGQFSKPSGIALNGPYMYIGSGQEYDYPIYVTDFSNNRIVKFIYNMNNTGAIWGWRIKPNSFSTVKIVENPYDIELHNGINNGTTLSDQNDDIIWYTANYSGFKELHSIDVNGNVKNYVSQFNFNGQNYPLNPDKISVYQSPGNTNPSVNVLGCIDNDLHCVVFFKLNPDGTLPSNNPTASSVWRFNTWDVLTSIKFMSTNPNLGLDAFVTYNHDGNGCINLFKIYIINGQPISDYLASSFSGFNSDNQFIKLNEIANQNGYVSFFSLENWSNEYGVRKYKAGLDVIGTPTLTTYCLESNNMTYKIRLTNPSIASFKAERKPPNGQWTPITLYISGYGSQTDNILLPSGTHNLVMSMSSFDNPIDLDNIRIFSKFLPSDENFSSYISSHLIEYPPMSTVITSCNIIGGCPFVYVEKSGKFELDNNILHRSEFDENIGKDIEDKYILRVAPEFNQLDSTCQIKIKELNNDISYFDKFSLITVDHPLGTNLGITEKNDYVLYFPQITSSPNYAEQNGNDVTSELGYDSSFTKTVKGEKDDNVSASFENVNSKMKKIQMKNFMRNSLKWDKGNNINNKKSGNLSDSQLEDSVAVLIDPSQSDRIINIGPPIKKPAGTITAIDGLDPGNPIEREFAKRQNTSPVIIVIGKNTNIDSVISIWNSNYMISYLAITPVYYGGYVENTLDLIDAIDSISGNVLNSLLNVDEIYSEMDSTTNITLKFKNTFGSIKQGFVRDYVLITNGRYENSLQANRGLISSQENQSIEIPKDYMLHQNFPNPFNPTTTIKFDIPVEGIVSIKVYNILGKEVYSIKENKQAGYHQLKFNGGNLSSGIYFYRITVGNFVQTKRMVLIK